LSGKIDIMKSGYNYRGEFTEDEQLQNLSKKSLGGFSG
jgi:hypothetical protein